MATTKPGILERLKEDVVLGGGGHILPSAGGSAPEKHPRRHLP